MHAEVLSVQIRSVKIMSDKVYAALVTVKRSSVRPKARLRLTLGSLPLEITG